MAGAGDLFLFGTGYSGFRQIGSAHVSGTWLVGSTGDAEEDLPARLSSGPLVFAANGTLYCRCAEGRTVFPPPCLFNCHVSGKNNKETY